MNSAATDKTSYIMLEIDQTKLAFPKKDLSTIINKADISPSRIKEKNSIQYINTPSGDYPLVCFTSQLAPRTLRYDEKAYFACLGEDEQERIAIACQDYLTLELSSWELTPIPEVMQTSLTPLLSLLNDGEEVVLISNLDSIVCYLEQCSEVYKNAWNF